MFILPSVSAGPGLGPGTKVGVIEKEYLREFARTIDQEFTSLLDPAKHARSLGDDFPGAVTRVARMWPDCVHGDTCCIVEDEPLGASRFGTPACSGLAAAGGCLVGNAPPWNLSTGFREGPRVDSRPDASPAHG